jgi:putative protease
MVDNPTNIESTAKPLAPELLAPAGNWDCARAAIENGADAIYFGLAGFNARMRADNFTTTDLPELMDFLHQRNVRGYVTMNTLIFADELEAAEKQLRAIIEADVDAAIVQDIGLCRLIRSISPDFPIHASTQMTITSTAGVRFAEALGCQLVVMARECSLKELEAIQKDLKQDHASSGVEMPLEVFVHGALCVAYSGQCLTSEALGGRSANRGECAQACRMPYDLIKDGEQIPLGDQKYLLSPQDLAGLPALPELIRLGMRSLKIEGRLKTPEYVANVTRVYRKAIDQITETQSPAPSSGQRLFEHSKYDLEMAFSRGLYTGWFNGIDNQKLVHARFGKKRGVYLGRIQSIHRDGFTIETKQPVKAGDGVVIDQGNPDKPEQGGRLFKVVPLNQKTVGSKKTQSLRLSFQHNRLNTEKLNPGDRVWKTSDPALDRTLRQSSRRETKPSGTPISITAQGSVGSKLEITAHHPTGKTIRVFSDSTIQEALKRPLDASTLQKQFGRLGETDFQLDQVSFKCEGPCMLPVSELNSMRREMVVLLNELPKGGSRWQLQTRPNHDKPTFSEESKSYSSLAPQLIPLVRHLHQLKAAIASGCPQVYCDFEDPKKYREAVNLFREMLSDEQKSNPNTGIWVAPPRITKPEEEWILKQVQSSDADGYLIRNYDHLEFFKNSQQIADFSFNVSNPWTASYLLNTFDLDRLTVSYDLNFDQVQALISSMPTDRLEITLHQHMPMFHMEHCVFCAFMSDGKDYRDCGRPCDKHEVELRDRVGQLHPLKADAGCRNTVYNGRAQTGAEYASQMIALGIRYFRVEFINESESEVRQTLETYHDLLSGKVDGSSVWQSLKLINQLGVTRGTLESPVSVDA